MRDFKDSADFGRVITGSSNFSQSGLVNNLEFNVELKDYADIEKHGGSGRQIPSHDWAAAILPGLLAFINSIITALCANVLYKIFNDDILTSVLAYQNAYPVNVNQNSITNIPNQDVIVTGNNAGIMPPIYQSGNNLNNK